jgi:hypothetical protein
MAQPQPYEEELRSGGWSPRGAILLGAALTAVAAVLAVLFVRHLNEAIAGHPEAAPLLRPSTGPSLVPTGNQALTTGTGYGYSITELPHQQRRVAIAVDLVNGANQNLTVQYPILVTGPGVGARIHVISAVVGAGTTGSAVPPTIGRIGRFAQVQLWIGLRLDCAGRHPPHQPSTRDVRVTIRLLGVSAPATFRLRDLLPSDAPEDFPSC